MSFSPYSNSLSSLYQHQTEPPPLESTILEDFSKPTIFSKDTLTTKPKKPPSSEGLLTNQVSKDLQNKQINLEQCAQLKRPLYSLSAGSSQLSDLSSDSSVKHCDNFSLQENQSQTYLNLDISPDIASDLFTFTDDFSTPDLMMSDMLASDSSEAANTSPSSFTSSSLSTPVVDKINGTDPDIKFVLDDVTLDSLLAEPMYDDKDVSDTSKWDPLFLSQSPSAPVVPLEAKLVREKRTAVVFDEENGDDAEAQLPSKKQKQEEAQESFESLAESTNLRISDGTFSDLPPIVVKDPSDPKALRRARNTAAARRSRCKKREKMSELEARVAELERANIQLSIENQILRNMKSMPPRN